LRGIFKKWQPENGSIRALGFEIRNKSLPMPHLVYLSILISPLSKNIFREIKPSNNSRNNTFPKFGVFAMTFYWE
jgi:hypothetical protein